MSGDTVTRIAPPGRRMFMERSRGERYAIAWWAVVRATLFRWSPPGLRRWRVLLLRLFGGRVDGSARIAPSARIDHPWNLRLGRDVVICRGAVVNCLGRVEVGEGTVIGPYAHLCAASHDYERPDMEILRQPITIGRDVRVAADAFVGPGVAIGDRCVLAPRSSAFADLPAGQVCMGEPARPRRPREER